VTLYSIFDRDHGAPEAPVAVPERFSWLAALLPPAFGLAHGLWLELIAFVVAVGMIAVASLWLGAGAGFWLYVLFAVLIGLEAPTLRRGALRRKGWTYRTERFAAGEDLAQVDWLRSRGVAR
jgi:hypothetical protein